MGLTSRVFFSLAVLASVVLSISAADTPRRPHNPQPADVIPDTLNQRVELGEVTVKPQGEKYSKKNNPAVDFVRLLKEQSSLSDPMNRPHYNFEVYDRITIAINEIQDSAGNIKGPLKNFPQLINYIDTSEVTGKTILPISVKEKVTEFYHSSDPSKTREYVSGIKRIGLDAIGNEESVQVYLEDMLREVDLYKNDIQLLSNKFVSPLSSIGPDFYKYYLVDTIPESAIVSGKTRELYPIESDSLIVLEFIPKNSSAFGFAGRLYIPTNAKRNYVRKVKMLLPKNANVNFVESLGIDQEFYIDSLGCRHKILDNLTVEMSLVPGTQGVYAQKYTRCLNHNYIEHDPRNLFNRLGSIYNAADAYIKDEQFWDFRRDETYRTSHRSVSHLASSLRSNVWYYWTEKVLNVLVTGYVPLGKEDKVELGPVNTLVSFNDVEGCRFRVGGLTTANLNKHWFFRGYGAYGTKDHRWKYYGEAEYALNEKKRHSREFPVRSIRASYRYDTQFLGQDYAFTNPDNIFLSFKRMDDTIMTYARTVRMEYTSEFDNHLSINFAVQNQRQESTRYVKFNFADGSSLPHLDFTTATFTIRYAPGEKFIQTKSERIPVNIDAPVIQISHTYGPGGALGSSRYFVNKTELDIRKRFWFSAFGYSDVTIRGGHVWSTSPFTQLFIPNANMTYTIQPESFTLLSPLEFIADTYAAWDVTYWANGALFNYIPYLKRLRLRESISFRGFWGRLSDKNNPEYNPWLPQFPVGSNPVTVTNTPYMELGVGIDNIFKILRVEYSWRLSYRNTPGVDRSGLRIALHFNF